MPFGVSDSVCVRLDGRKMWDYFFISLSMRPAYNNPFNQAPNPSERRQHAINKAVHFLIFLLGRTEGGHRLWNLPFIKNIPLKAMGKSHSAGH